MWERMPLHESVLHMSTNNNSLKPDTKLILKKKKSAKTPVLKETPLDAIENHSKYSVKLQHYWCYLNFKIIALYTSMVLF